MTLRLPAAIVPRHMAGIFNAAEILSGPVLRDRHTSE
jgi:hypothetical protein